MTRTEADFNKLKQAILDDTEISDETKHFVKLLWDTVWVNLDIVMRARFPKGSYTAEDEFQSLFGVLKYITTINAPYTVPEKGTPKEMLPGLLTGLLMSVGEKIVLFELMQKIQMEWYPENPELMKV